MTNIPRRNARPLNARARNARGRNAQDDPFYFTGGLDPSSLQFHRMHQALRFTAEPQDSPVTMSVNGTTVVLPKYNGVLWWFPKPPDGGELSIVEIFFYRFFTIVNATQTCSLFIWPAILVYRFGWLYTLASMPLTVPVGSHIEDNFGPNTGTAYASLHALYLSFHLLDWVLVVANHNSAVILGAFVALTLFIGRMLALVERDLLGRTWYAAVVAYAHLGIWVHCLFQIVTSLLV